MAARNIRNLDLYVPNFDHHLLRLLETMSPQQKELVPSELIFKMFKNGLAVVDKLNFIEKMYLLSVCFKQTIFVGTMAENGLSAKDFKNAIEAQKGNIRNSDLLDDMKLPVAFIQGDKELIRAMSYMNHTQCSDIYNLVRGAHPKNISKRESKFREFQQAQGNLMKMIAHYEGNKKDVLIHHNLSVPKLYALLYFFDGEKFGKDFYNVAFRHAYTSNRADLSTALKELNNEGYLNRRGGRMVLKYAITAKGLDLATKVMNKLIFNY
jgi:hypothetical protein